MLFLTIVNIALVTSAIGLFLYALAIAHFLKSFVNIDTKRSLQYAIFIGLAGFIILRLNINFLMEVSPRMGLIFSNLLNFNFQLVLLDQSASSRFGSIYMAIWGSFDNYFLPTPPNTFQSFFEENITSIRHIFSWGNPTERPMSGMATFIYEFGFFGALTIALFLFLIARLFKGEVFLGLGVVFLSRIQLASATSDFASKNT